MLTYFLQVNVCWLLFYGIYYALLSKETFFRLNRIYLIISLLCGLMIPVIVPKVDMPMVQPLVEVVQPITASVVQMQEFVAVQTLETETRTWDILSFFMKLYSLGVAFFLLKFCWGLVTILKLYRNGQKERNDDFSLIHTERVKTPFSFFNWIFVNQKTIENTDYQQIILHESAHVRQRHSLDIVGLEILRGLFWLSPLVHLYARSLRNVHEYLADAAVLQNTEKKQYGRLLISQTAAGSSLVLANHLNFSQLKKRIIMMSRNPSNRLALTKYAFAAPAFLLIVVLLTSPKTQVLATTAKFGETMTTAFEETLNGNPQAVKPKSIFSAILSLASPLYSARKPPFDVVKNPIPNPMARLLGENKEDTLKEQLNDKYPLEVKMPENTINDGYAWKKGDNTTGTMPVFPGGEAEIEKFINANLKYPEACKKAGRSAMFFVNYTITEDGYVTDIKSWDCKWSNPKISTTDPKIAKFDKYEKMEVEDQPMIDEAFRIIKSMPRWKPGTRNGVVSRYSKSFMFKFILD
jgi:hypothetical protein